MTSTDPTKTNSTTMAAAPSWTHLTRERRSPCYWRVTFDHPPINTITATTVIELSELVDLIERDTELNALRLHHPRHLQPRDPSAARVGGRAGGRAGALRASRWLSVTC